MIFDFIKGFKIIDAPVAIGAGKAQKREDAIFFLWSGLNSGKPYAQLGESRLAFEVSITLV